MGERERERESTETDATFPETTNMSGYIFEDNYAHSMQYISK